MGSVPRTEVLKNSEIKLRTSKINLNLEIDGLDDENVTVNSILNFS